MRARRLPPAAVRLLLAAGAFGLAFAQRPGWATADTKINLHVAPGAFLGEVARMWTATGQLGDVQAAQQVGYLFPMGPFFALGHGIGLSPWVVQRLWLGALLALAAWGVVSLLEELRPSSGGLATFAAGAVSVLNPFVVTYANRTTVTLLAYAALPWLLLVTHRGLRRRGWRWPAAAALLVTVSGGGVNGAVTAWMLVGPLVLLLYELWIGDASRSDVLRFALPSLLLTLLLSLWWVVSAWLQAKYGANFLQFTEQPGTVWGTTSATESLRLMSFWLSYVGIGFAGRAIPYFDDSPTLLFSGPVVLATLLLPAGALGSFLAARRWRYGPFFLALALLGVLVMMAGFPDGTILRHGLTFTYNHVASVRFLRASYKAAPLVAVGYAALAGVGVEVLWSRLARRRAAAAWRAALVATVAAVLALAAWPLVTGTAQDRQVSFRQVPAAWRAAAAGLDRGMPSGFRGLVLPGQLFSFYDWGGTVDPILPVLTRRPVAIRTEVPYGDLRATDLLWTIDGLLHQGRLLPGELGPLVRLIGAGAVITGTDDDLARSDAPPPADVAARLAAQRGFAQAARNYGPRRLFTGSAPGPAVALPQVRRYNIAGARPEVRIETGAPTVVDGSAEALAGLAAFGRLPSRGPLLYGADLSAGQLRHVLTAGGRLVISDTNRRRAFAAATLEQNVGPTLSPAENVSADGLILDPFGRGTDAETVAEYGGGISLVHAPASPLRPQFPEHSPFAAVDGDPDTAWLPDPTLVPARRWLEVDFPAPRDIASIRLLPYGDARGSVTAVTIGARTFAVRPGWNRLPAGLHGVRALRVGIAAVSRPARGTAQGPGGIRDLTVPGVRPTESLRAPVDAARAVGAAALRRAELDVLLGRTTGDEPFRRNPAASVPWSSFDVHHPGDAETTIHRIVELPAPRRYRVTAWVSVSPSAADAVLDRLLGARGEVVVSSSGRLAGEPRWRASSALDGDPASAWVVPWSAAAPPWVAWRTPEPRRLGVLRLRAPSFGVSRPTRVRLDWPGGSSGVLRVGAGGLVRLPRAARARRFRLTVLGAAGGRTTNVGIAEIEGAPRVRMPAPTGGFTAPCGAFALLAAGRPVPLRVDGSMAAVERGDPLRATACGGAVALPAGAAEIASRPGPLLVDEVLLHSPAPVPAASATGRWLVYGQSYNLGWRARCDGHVLGTPRPIDGYANGWPLSGPCLHPTFSFAPQRPADAAYVVSALAAVVCLLLLLRPRRPTESVAAEGVAPSRFVRQLAPGRAVAVAVIAGLGFAIAFGGWAGVLAVPVTALVLRGRVGAAPLVAAAALLLAIAVPSLYLVHPVSSTGGNHYGYPAAHMAANRVGVAAIGLLMLALWRSLMAVRRGRGSWR